MSTDAKPESDAALTDEIREREAQAASEPQVIDKRGSADDLGTDVAEAAGGPELMAQEGEFTELPIDADPQAVQIELQAQMNTILIDIAQTLKGIYWALGGDKTASENKGVYNLLHAQATANQVAKRAVVAPGQ